jgi:hypothetical protein
MEMHFVGICTHIVRTAGQPHRVMLPAAHGYRADGPSGKIAIPDHTPSLGIRKEDVIDPSEIAAFEGNDLIPMLETDHSNYKWRLSNVTFTISELTGGVEYAGGELCLPHLGRNAELDRSVRDGVPEPAMIEATVDLHGGTLHTVKDMGTARHVKLTSDLPTPWHLAVIAPGGDWRRLQLAAGAVVAFGNTAHDEHSACAEDDYLLHYRLTHPSYVDREAFKASVSCHQVKEQVDVSKLPIITPNSTTLSNCSNSIYP